MDKKVCFKCGEEKTLDMFYKHPQMSGGRVNKCKECNKLDVNKNRKLKSDYYKSYDLMRYRKQEERIKRHKYQGIVNRCTGKHKNRSYAVEGRRYLTWDSFEKWWKNNREKFLELYKVWEKSGYENKLAPSIDRINNRRGYMPSNMQWLSLTENNKKYNK